MNVPLMNLHAPLEGVAESWRASLEQLFARAHFVLGQELSLFESEFAAELDARFAVGVGSGTAAIELCLREAGITTREQEVITSPLTAPFTGIAILAAGASIKFCDVDPDTLLLDPVHAEMRMTSRTAAIVPVHLYGQPCDLDRLSALRLPLIQDACQAHGAAYKGRPFTDYSPHVAYSFYPTKNLGCLGDGGAIVTSDATIANRLSMLRDGGRADAHVSILPGINSRLDEIQCCFLRAFLPHLREWNQRRSRIAALYDQAFHGFEPVRPVLRREPSVHHLYVVRAPNRDRLREHLAEHGVGTGIHYPVPLHLHPTFEKCGAMFGDLPHAERACREIVSLPIWPQMEEAQALYVIDQVKSFY